MFGLCSDAYLTGIKRAIATEATAVEVVEQDFAEALEGMTPSVSVEELKYYESLSQQF